MKLSLFLWIGASVVQFMRPLKIYDLNKSIVANNIITSPKTIVFEFFIYHLFCVCDFKSIFITLYVLVTDLFQLFLYNSYILCLHCEGIGSLSIDIA